MFYRQMLIEHCQNGDHTGVLDILEKASSIPRIYDTLDPAGNSALHCAAFRGDEKVCRILVERGANVMAKDKFGKTPAHLVIQKGYEKLARLFLERSHPLNYPRDAKMTLMQVAAAYGRDEIVKLLAHRGCNINERNNIGETPLHLATKNDKLGAMRALIKLGADICPRIDRVGHTPMHYACMYGLQEASVLLLESGANAHEPNDTELGRTPLETAKDSGFRPLFNLLLDLESRCESTSHESTS